MVETNFRKMGKFLVLGMILGQQVVPNVSGGSLSDGAKLAVLPLHVQNAPLNNDSSQISTIPGVPGLYNYVINQTVDINGFMLTYSIQMNLRNAPITTNVNEVVRTDCPVESTDKTFKLYRRQLTWNEARRQCTKDGGHLAIIRTSELARAVNNLMRSVSVEDGWVGFHDLFNEGEWLSVLDEPINKMKWTPWPSIGVEPNNMRAKKHCASFRPVTGGLNDDECGKLYPFVCEIPNPK